MFFLTTLKTYFLKALIALCNISIKTTGSLLLYIWNTSFCWAPFQSWIKLNIYIFFKLQIFFINHFASKILYIFFLEFFIALKRHALNFYNFTIFNIWLQMIFHTVFTKFIMSTLFKIKHIMFFIIFTANLTINSSIIILIDWLDISLCINCLFLSF